MQRTNSKFYCEKRMEILTLEIFSSNSLFSFNVKIIFIKTNLFLQFFRTENTNINYDSFLAVGTFRKIILSFLLLFAIILLFNFHFFLFNFPFENPSSSLRFFINLNIIIKIPIAKWKKMCIVIETREYYISSLFKNLKQVHRYKIMGWRRRLYKTT